MSRIYITTLVSLKSEQPYDNSRNIMESTHEHIIFCEYDDPDNPRTGYTTYSLVIPQQELFELLKDRCTVLRRDGYIR